MRDKQLCRARKPRVPRCRNADIPVLLQIKPLPNHMVPVHIRKERMHHADAKPAFHHGKDHMVAVYLVAHLRRAGKMRKEIRKLVVRIFLELDKRLILQARNGKNAAACKRVIRREHRNERIALQKMRLQIRHRRQAHKPAIHLPMLDPILDFRIILAVHEREFDAGVQLLKRHEQRWDPHVRHARKRAHPDEPRMQAVQLVHGELQLRAVRHDGTHQRQQAQPLRAGRYARAAAVKQLHAPFLFQIQDHAAHGGLGVPHLFRCKADAAKLHGLKQRGIFLQAHSCTIPFCFFMYNIKNIRLRNIIVYYKIRERIMQCHFF